MSSSGFLNTRKIGIYWNKPAQGHKGPGTSPKRLGVSPKRLASIKIAFLLHAELVKGLFEKAGCKFWWLKMWKYQEFSESDLQVEGETISFLLDSFQELVKLYLKLWQVSLNFDKKLYTIHNVNFRRHLCLWINEKWNWMLAFHLAIQLIIFIMQQKAIISHNVILKDE